MNSALDRFIKALEDHGFKYKKQGYGYRAQCPGHDGKRTNLAFAQGDQGVIVKCHSRDCSESDIVKSLGLERSDLFDNRQNASYQYGRATVVRTRTGANDKTVKPAKAGTLPEMRPLWQPANSALIEVSETVHLAEGEKTADALNTIGASCVATWQGGAGGVNKADLTALKDKHVIIVADRDQPGLKAAGVLSERLQNIAAKIEIKTVPNSFNEVTGLNDAADLLLADGKLKDLEAHELTGLQAPKIVSVKASEIKPEKQEWLWHERIPKNILALFAGRGGEGKSTFALHIISQLTKGTLEGDFYGRPVNIGLASLEDDPATVTVPRLMAAGADLERIHLFTKDDTGHLIRLPESVDTLQEFIKRENLKIVVLDPATSLMAGNHNNRHEVRTVLDPLADVAMNTGCTFILVMHHNKGLGLYPCSWTRDFQYSCWKEVNNLRNGKETLP